MEQLQRMRLMLWCDELKSPVPPLSSVDPAGLSRWATYSFPAYVQMGLYGNVPKIELQFWPESVQRSLKARSQDQGDTKGAGASYAGREPLALSFSALLDETMETIYYEDTWDEFHSPSEPKTYRRRIDSLHRLAASQRADFKGEIGAEQSILVPRVFFASSSEPNSVMASLRFLMTATGMLDFGSGPAHPMFLLDWSISDPMVCWIREVRFTIERWTKLGMPTLAKVDIDLEERTRSPAEMQQWMIKGGKPYHEMFLERVDGRLKFPSKKFNEIYSSSGDRPPTPKRMDQLTGEPGE